MLTRVEDRLLSLPPLAIEILLFGLNVTLPYDPCIPQQNGSHRIFLSKLIATPTMLTSGSIKTLPSRSNTSRIISAVAAMVAIFSGFRSSIPKTNCAIRTPTCKQS